MAVIFCSLALEDFPESQRFLHRYHKRFVPFALSLFAQAIGLALQKKSFLSLQAVRKLSRGDVLDCLHELPPFIPQAWIQHWLRHFWTPSGTLRVSAAPPQSAPGHSNVAQSRPPTPSVPAVAPPPLIAAPQQSAKAVVDPLPKLPITVHAADYSAEHFHPSSPDLFRARHTLLRLRQQRNYDELLCLDQLCGVEQLWYQIESVRRVLKQFQGRVLLADEVGLGKTIEACMALKEYIVRGMVKSCLILAPASLVNQWRDELRSKFQLTFATSYEYDAPAWCALPFVIASLQSARRSEVASAVQQQHFDLVIVDEAHHLKNRTSKNWMLVNGLQARYLFLISATPLQNNLIELYNLLLLLKPGLFKSESDFRKRYNLGTGKRVPRNNLQELQQLMREVMIRNTRSLVDIKLPPRHAATIKVPLTPAEHAAYQALSAAVADLHAEGHSLLGRTLLQLAGSCGSAVAHGLERAAVRAAQRGTGADPGGTTDFVALREQFVNLGYSSKIRAFIELVRKNPHEKVLVFVQYRETMTGLCSALQDEGANFCVFDGSLTAAQKDAAIRAFETDVQLMLCTESGGEGRNLQFCNTLVNFDIPWNPQVIEQRIGRIHRFGQQRDVFVFNLAAQGTVEDHILGILDEKLNMFELVVGEMQSILGELEDGSDLSQLIFETWCAETTAGVPPQLAKVEETLRSAQEHYQQGKELDQQVFGRELEVV